MGAPVSTDALALLSAGSLYLALRLALPVLLGMALVGAVVAFVQAGSQTHEPSLGFVAKLAAAALVLFFFHAFMTGSMLGFSTDLWQRIAQVVR